MIRDVNFHLFMSIIVNIWGIIGMFEKHNWSKLEHKQKWNIKE